jgi:hypothetical protein
LFLPFEVEEDESIVVFGETHECTSSRDRVEGASGAGVFGNESLSKTSERVKVAYVRFNTEVGLEGCGTMKSRSFRSVTDPDGEGYSFFPTVLGEP